MNLQITEIDKPPGNLACCCINSIMNAYCYNIIRNQLYSTQNSHVCMLQHHECYNEVSLFVYPAAELLCTSRKPGCKRHVFGSFETPFSSVIVRNCGPQRVFQVTCLVYSSHHQTPTKDTWTNLSDWQFWLDA